MGRNFEFYRFSLDFLRNEVLGSKNQEFIDRAYKELQKKLGFWDDYLQEVISDLYLFQLNLLVNEGKFESNDFPWEKYTFPRERDGEEKDLEFATKVDAIVALFTHQPEAYGFGGYNHERYKILFANLQKVLPVSEQEAEHWEFLLEGRPLTGDKIYVSDSGYSYYGYLTREEAMRLFKSVEIIKRPENQAKLKELPEDAFSSYVPFRPDLDLFVKDLAGQYDSLKDPENLSKFKEMAGKIIFADAYKHPDLDVLDSEIEELSTGNGDLFFEVA